jgi:mRNA-degrading endonuclease RelE of RelBE toxin-antitoxin system
VPFQVHFSSDAGGHLRHLTASQRATLIDQVEVQLVDQPTLPSRNRKHMRENSLAAWELRIGNLRVYYDVEEEPEPMVLIRAIGIKERNQVRIGGKLRKL